MDLLLQFMDQLEQIGELVIVVIIAALLTPATLAGRDITDLLLLFFIIRPLAILVGLARMRVSGAERHVVRTFSHALRCLHVIFDQHVPICDISAPWIGHHRGLDTTAGRFSAILIHLQKRRLCTVSRLYLWASFN